MHKRITPCNGKFKSLLLFVTCASCSIVFYNSVDFVKRSLEFNRLDASTNLPPTPLTRPANPCYSDRVYTALMMEKLPQLEKEPRFQKFGVSGGVYSAYYDAREPAKRVVRIFGVLRSHKEAFCHVIGRSAEGNMEIHVVKGEVNGMDLTKRERNVDFFMVNCPLEEGLPVPLRVGLSHERCGDPIASLQVFNTFTKSPKYNFTVCLHQPLFQLTMEDVPRILEWIAVNRVFGGEHFVIYTLPSTEMIRTYLQPLVDTGLVEIHIWGMEYDPLKTQSQRAVINECIYRHMYTSNRIALMDFDEFPTPHADENWPELIEHSPCANSSAASFRNAFFPSHFIDDPPRTDLKVTALRKTKRVSKSTPCHSRSKLILNPRQIRDCSVHYLRTLVDGVKPGECCVPEELGFLHHYRWRGEYRHLDPAADNITGISTDHRMWHFEGKIVESMHYVYSALNRQLQRVRSAGPDS